MSSHDEKIQACFLGWLKANSLCFAVPPVVTSRTDQMIEVTFEGSTPIIKARLTRQRLSAESGARTLIALDLPTGVVEHTCGLISPGKVVFHDTVEAAWVYQFDRYLKAVNRYLAGDRA